MWRAKCCVFSPGILGLATNGLSLRLVGRVETYLRAGRLKSEFVSWSVRSGITFYAFLDS